MPTLVLEHARDIHQTQTCLKCLVSMTRVPRFLTSFKFDVLPILDLLSHDLPTILLVVQLLSNLSSDCFLTECFVTSHTDRKASILSSLCALCSNNRPSDVIMEQWMEFLTKAVRFLSIVTCKSEALLSKHKCFSIIYQTVNIVLYKQLVLWEKNALSWDLRNHLIKECIILLHGCSNIYVDGVPGVKRDHRHLIVLWKLQGYVETQDPNVLVT
uniref:Uncharacterized protein n=1 Tax=Ciona savignyi TaxID=51511 RepID=H2YP74_CIOSA